MQSALIKGRYLFLVPAVKVRINITVTHNVLHFMHIKDIPVNQIQIYLNHDK